MFAAAFSRQVMQPLQHCRFQHAKRFCSSAASTVSEKQLRPVAYWIFGVGGLVAGMVTVGGITRLTKSGLSMTDWKLQGSLPPMNTKQWEMEFDRFKQFPEWQQRKSMTLDEFKFIFFWEYGHRMMGRFVGLAFALPATYFIARGRIPRSMYPRLGTLFTLGLSQGLIGWWMVKSGLNLDPEQKKEIRVSPYRLATHLSMAFTTYTLLLWTGLDLINSKTAAQRTAAKLGEEVLRQARKTRQLAFLNMALVASTVLSGAYVAGNDAGNAFNTFPKMGDEWIPSEILEMKPLWRNFFENTATVQFDHRVLALTSMVSIGHMYHRAMRSGASQFPRFARLALHASAGMVLVQVSLGISTLLLYVPVSLAALHQFGSLTLLTFLTCLAHSLNFSLPGGGPKAGAGAASASARVLSSAFVGAAAALRTVARTATVSTTTAAAPSAAAAATVVFGHAVGVRRAHSDSGRRIALPKGPSRSAHIPRVYTTDCAGSVRISKPSLPQLSHQQQLHQLQQPPTGKRVSTLREEIPPKRRAL